MSADQHSTAHHTEAAMSKKKIWNVFWVLFGITSIEFFIALVLIPKGIMGHEIGNILYITLTLMKAYYIVAYFMHLKFEKLGLIYSILIPTLFIIFFIIWMLYEGNYWLNIRL